MTAIDAQAELKRQQDEAVAEERKMFVRDAAIQLAVAFRLRDPIVTFSPADGKLAWDVAQTLWGTKPEDC